MILDPDRILFERARRLEVVVIVVIRAAGRMGMSQFPSVGMVLQGMRRVCRRHFFIDHCCLLPPMRYAGNRRKKTYPPSLARHRSDDPGPVTYEEMHDAPPPMHGDVPLYGICFLYAEQTLASRRRYCQSPALLAFWIGIGSSTGCCVHWSSKAALCQQSVEPRIDPAHIALEDLV